MGSRLSSTPPPGGSGTVTSVGLSASGLLHTVSGSPVTSAGTLGLTLKTQVAGSILCGPISGADATPTMRALDPLDVPSLDAGKITSGTFGAARIGSVNPSVLTGTGTVPLAALSGLTTTQLDGAAAITSAQIAALATSKLTGTISAAQLAVSAPTSGQLGGLATANLSASAGLLAGQIASVNPSALTGSGTVPLAGLSGLTTSQLAAGAGILGSQLDAAAAIASGQITSLAAAKITGSATLPDGVLSANVPLLSANNAFTTAGSAAASGTPALFAITPTLTQSGTAGYTALRVYATETSTGSGSKLLADFGVGSTSKGSLDDTGFLTAVTIDATKLTGAVPSGSLTSVPAANLTGTVALARLAAITTTQLSATAGILGSQLDAAAAIASGQITSLAASKLTGTNTLPDSVLSTNVPLLASANTFTAAQTVSATVAGVLAQINNASTTGAGLVIGSTTVASAGAGKIAPALALTQAPAATANYGLLSVGSGPWDGSTTGKYLGNANGTALAVNAASGFSGNLFDMQVAGAAYIRYNVGGGTSGLEIRQGTNQSQTACILGNGGQNFFSQPIRNNTGTLTLGNASDTGCTALAAAASVPLICKGAASATADLQQWQNSAGNVEFGVTNRGSAGSPIWALKVRAVANAESMAQAHTIGAATGKAIEVMDDAGASLGWLALYA